MPNRLHDKLIKAIQKERINLVRSLIVEHGVDVNFPDKSGNIALIKAVEKENLEIIKLLIENRANINLQNTGGWTALIKAVEKENLEIIKLLIENEVDIDKKDINKETALFKAINLGNLEIVKLLVDHRADLNARGDKEKTALFEVAYIGNLEMLRLLVDSKANVNLQDINGDTALVNALERGSVDVIKLLIDSGTSINLQNNNRETALFKAINLGNLEMVKLLVDNEANINLQNNNGETVLFEAINHKSFKELNLRTFRLNIGNLEIVKLLVDHGTDINIQNNQGSTALMEAIKVENSEIAKFLVDNGADVNIQDKDENTALDFLVRCVSPQLHLTTYFIDTMKDMFINDTTLVENLIIHSLRTSNIYSNSKKINTENMLLLLCKEFPNELSSFSDFRAGELPMDKRQELFYKVEQLETFINDFASSINKIIPDEVNSNLNNTILDRVASFSHLLSLYAFSIEHSYYSFYINRFFYKEHHSAANKTNKIIEQNMFLLLLINKTGLGLPQDLEGYINSFIIDEFTNKKKKYISGNDKLQLKKMVEVLDYIISNDNISDISENVNNLEENNLFENAENME